MNTRVFPSQGQKLAPLDTTVRLLLLVTWLTCTLLSSPSRDPCYPRLRPLLLLPRTASPLTKPPICRATPTKNWSLFLSPAPPTKISQFPAQGTTDSTAENKAKDANLSLRAPQVYPVTATVRFVATGEIQRVPSSYQKPTRAARTQRLDQKRKKKLPSLTNSGSMDSMIRPSGGVIFFDSKSHDRPITYDVSGRHVYGDWETPSYTSRECLPFSLAPSRASAMCKTTPNRLGSWALQHRTTLKDTHYKAKHDPICSPDTPLLSHLLLGHGLLAKAGDSCIEVFPQQRLKGFHMYNDGGRRREGTRGN